jgi:hypothetical protein
MALLLVSTWVALPGMIRRIDQKWQAGKCAQPTVFMTDPASPGEHIVYRVHVYLGVQPRSAKVLASLESQSSVEHLSYSHGLFANLPPFQAS